MTNSLREKLLPQLRYWWPALAWALLIFFFSTSAFRGDTTSDFLLPLLRRLFPAASLPELFQIHAFLRKCGHAVGYAVLSLLALRGMRRGRAELRPVWLLGAWLLATLYAGTDEIHQSFEWGRTGSAWDVLLDSASAAVALALAAAWLRRQKTLALRPGTR